MPVVFSKKPPPSRRWRAYFDPEALDPQSPSIFILPPASASLGFYRFRLNVQDGGRWKAAARGTFALLFNPWCSGEWLSLARWRQRGLDLTGAASPLCFRRGLRVHSV